MRWKVSGIAEQRETEAKAREAKQEAKRDYMRSQAKGIRMSDAERRERNRLRSERWRRAHGIMPRKPASKPWLALGVSRSTWRAKACQEAALAIETAQRREVLARAEAFVAQLQAELAEAARCQVITAAIIGEFQVSRRVWPSLL